VGCGDAEAFCMALQEQNLLVFLPSVSSMARGFGAQIQVQSSLKTELIDFSSIF
jgi:hypothetical protein